MKKLLVVIDYQNDFVDGALGFSGAEKLDELIVKRIEEYEKEGADIVATMDTHFDDYLDTVEGKNLPVKHCIKSTKGWELYGKTGKKLENSRIFEKYTFGSTELGSFMMDNSYDKIELCGLVTNICIITNAIIAKSACPEAEILVDSSLIGSYDETLGQKAIDIMKNLHIRVI